MINKEIFLNKKLLIQKKSEGGVSQSKRNYNLEEHPSLLFKVKIIFTNVMICALRNNYGSIIMPSTKEMLLNILKNTKKDSLSLFQIECLDMFQAKIKSIPVDEQTEMDLPVCGILLDHCFCDLDNLFKSEQRIISIINKGNLSDDDFFQQVNQIFDDEIKILNHFSSEVFYNQTLKHVKTIVIDMKNELGRLKTSLDHQLSDAPKLS